MNKDFNNWHKFKQKLNSNKREIYFYEKEIWFCSIGINVGYEQDGKNDNFERPVLILKKFNQYIFLGIPLTSQEKQGKYYFKFHFKGKPSIALLSQIRLWDRRRLIRSFGRIKAKDYKELINRIKVFFKKSDPRPFGARSRSFSIN